MIPSHTFKPGSFAFPYAQEIDRHMTKKGLLIREHDVEIGPQTLKRFERYIREKPERIHTAPYLITTPGKSYLKWAHRQLNATTADKLPKRVQEKFVNYLPAKPKPMEIVLTVPAWVQGGEPEVDYFPLGYTWMPRRIWDLVFQEVSTVDWTMLDTRISGECFRLGEKALVHWDCVASHWHV